MIIPDDGLVLQQLKRIQASLKRLELALEAQKRQLSYLEAGQDALFKMIADITDRSILR